MKGLAELATVAKTMAEFNVIITMFSHMCNNIGFFCIKFAAIFMEHLLLIVDTVFVVVTYAEFV